MTIHTPIVQNLGCICQEIYRGSIEDNKLSKSYINNLYF